jgi:hypothetical protein
MHQPKPNNKSNIVTPGNHCDREMNSSSQTRQKTTKEREHDAMGRSQSTNELRMLTQNMPHALRTNKNEKKKKKEEDKKPKLRQ